MAGIAFLRRLLMKQAVKESAPHSGIMSIGTDVRKLVDKKVNRWIDSAKKQGQDIDKMGEQEIKYIVELNKPKAPTTLADMVEKLGLNDPKKNRFLQKEGQVIQADFGGGITDDVSEIIIKIKTMKPMDSMKEANKVLKGEGRYKSLSKADRKKIVDDESVTDHIFERDIKPDPEDFAHGGRTGSGLNYLLGEDDQNVRMPFKKGFSAGRRKFVQGIGALAALPIVGKYFKWAKPLAKSSKVLTSVPIKAGADGMPVWFKPLVNKVIREGEDVTKKFATKEREIVHQVSIEGKIGKDALGVEDIRVTQSLDDGTIRVEYNSPNTIGESGVELTYTKGEIIPTKVKGKNTSVKTKDEFTAAEDDFYPQATSPDGDFDLEFTEHVVNKVDDLYSDTSKLKQFATGKKLTIKEISESMKKKNILREIENNPNEHAFRNLQDEPSEFASGGRVPLAEGYGVSDSNQKLDQVIGAYRKYYTGPGKKKRKIPFKIFFEMYAKENFASGGRVSLSAGGIAGMLGE